MLQKVNKLSDFLLSLLHAGHIRKLYLDIPQSFDLKALLIGDLRDDRIRGELPEDEESYGDSEERSYQTYCIAKGVPKTIGLVIEIHLYFLEPILLVMLEHRQEIVDVSIVAEHFSRAVLIPEGYPELRNVLLLLINVDLLDVFQQFIDEACFIDASGLQGLLHEYFFLWFGLSLEDEERDYRGREQGSKQLLDIFSCDIYLNIVVVFLLVLFLILLLISFHFFLLLTLLLFHPLWPGRFLNVVIAELQVLEIQLVVDLPIDPGIRKLRHQDRDVKREIPEPLTLHDLPIVIQ